MILRYVLVLILVFGGTSVINAQSIQWGASASASIHELDFDSPLPWWSSSELVFPSFALHAEMPMQFIEGPLGKVLWFSTGIRYARLASKVDFELELGQENQLFTGAFQINQHIVGIPIQFRLDLGQLPVYLLAGPEVDLLITANRSSETFTPVESRSSDTKQGTNDLKRINIAIYGGIGIHLIKGVDLFGKYGRGTSGALKTGEQTFSDSDWINEEVEIGLKVDFGK